uniref:Ammonium_transp domain-containing protein n=1 Tax=Macrostomum lignano TaxID=282301 RepID=A0A1I8F889_9PLAT
MLQPLSRIYPASIFRLIWISSAKAKAAAEHSARASCWQASSASHRPAATRTKHLERSCGASAQPRWNRAIEFEYCDAFGDIIRATSRFSSIVTQSPGSAAATMEFGVTPKFGAVALALQALLWRCLPHSPSYDEQADAGLWGNATGTAQTAEWYGFCSVGLNMLISALVIQWGMLVNGFFHLKDAKFSIDIQGLLAADFACAAVLISFGAAAGCRPLQCLVLSLVEIPIFVANEYAADMGGSMFVHVFGAYFGIAASKALTAPGDGKNSNDHSGLQQRPAPSFLWLYWPSFNAGLASRRRQAPGAVINTYLSLAALQTVKGKFEMSHIQNATPGRRGGRRDSRRHDDPAVRSSDHRLLGRPAQRDLATLKSCARRQHPGHVRGQQPARHARSGWPASWASSTPLPPASMTMGTGLYQIFFGQGASSRPTAALRITCVKDAHPCQYEGGVRGRPCPPGSQAAFSGRRAWDSRLLLRRPGFILVCPSGPGAHAENFFQDDSVLHCPATTTPRPVRGEGSAAAETTKEAEEPV